MFRFAVLACVLVSGLSAPTDYDDLDLPVLGIVGGSATTIERYPHQISLQFDGEHYCGGSIINEYTVLTAAHCTAGVPVNVMEVVAGTTHHNLGGVRIPVSKVIVHNDYNPNNFHSDICILHLATRLPLGPKIQPISIATNNQQVPVGGNAVVSGWGVTRENGQLSQVLNFVEVPIMSQRQCLAAYPSQISSSMICAGYPRGGKDACQADSGGPLILNGKQVGVVSWGVGCAKSGYPGVYTKVSEFANWINTNMKH